VAGQEDGPAPLASRSRAAALRETIDLIDELIDALVTQARRAQRQHEEAVREPGGVVDPQASAALLERLAQRAVSLADGMTELEATIGTAAPAAGGEMLALDEDERDSERPSDPARMLATEMVTQGRSRAEVEDYLVQTFGVDNASEIVEDVFSRTGGA
jgi:hypothetical protein